jgi:hypothetical protein
MARLTENQKDALRDMTGHGRTMASLKCHGLIHGFPGHWRLGVYGELILAGWTLDGIKSMRARARAASLSVTLGGGTA